MAIYHLSAKAIGRSQGRSSTAAAAYRAGVRITDERTGLVFDFRRKRGVDGSEIFTPDGSQPERGALWNAVEKVEKRADAQLAREVEIALPRELNPEQMRAAVRAFVRAEFVARGMVADVAFHHLTGTNPHAHILLTLRAWSAQGFGLKRREWNGRDLCLRWRESWAHHANEALKEAGHEIQIDHRTLVDQAATAAEQERYAEAINLDRVPTIHERGSRAAKSHNERVRQANIAQRLQSEVNEPKTHDDAQPEPEALPSRPLSAMEELAAADRAFEQTMQTQRDSMAALWRRHHDRAQRAAQWLAAYADEKAHRARECEQTALDLHNARYERDAWLRENHRPFWPWRRGAWKKQWAALQGPVDQAKRNAVKAQANNTREALMAWQGEYDAVLTKHAAAVTARRQLAEMPSEQEERKHIEAKRRKAARQAAEIRPAPPRPMPEENAFAQRRRMRPR